MFNDTPARKPDRLLGVRKRLTRTCGQGVETHDDSDAVASQVELGQGVHAGEVVHVADVVAGQVQHAQLQQVVQVLDHADLHGRKCFI